MAYCCSFIDKHIQVDSFSEGVRDNALTCTMAESVNITADTLRRLFDKIGESYCLGNIDDLFIPSESGSPSYVGWNRLETEGGSEPTADERSQWEQGKLDLYLADYGFTIEYRYSRCVTTDELKNEGFTFH